MKEGNKEVVGRAEDCLCEDDDRYKICGALPPWCDMPTLESLQGEEDCWVEEESVCDLMRDIMEEIGIEGDSVSVAGLPRPVAFSFQSLAEVSYAWCDSASSSTNCSSKPAGADYGGYAEARFGLGEENIYVAFGEGCEVGGVSVSSPYSLDMAFSEDVLWQMDFALGSESGLRFEDGDPFGFLCEGQIEHFGFPK